QGRRPHAAPGVATRGPGASEHQGPPVSTTVLVDAGGANLGSVRYALERLGAEVKVSADPGDIAQAARVILPGVGAAASGMARLHDRRLVEVLRDLQQPL